MTKIQLRRDTVANWTANNPTPVSGEPCFETDTGKFKIGDGTTAYNDLAYQGESSAPTNMVTIDTDQTITGKKVFLQPNSSNKGLNVALGSDATNPDVNIHIGKSSSSDFTGGMIRFDSTAAAIVGLQQQNAGGTLKFSSSGHTTSYAAGNTYIQNSAAWGSAKSGIHIPAYSATYPKVEIVGGSHTVGSSFGVDAKVSIGYEGSGAWAERKGVFIETSATANAIDSGAKLWLGQTDGRSAIYPVTDKVMGRCLNFETYPADNTNATLSIQKKDVVYTDSDGVVHSLISGSGTNTDLSNLSDTGKNNLVDNNCYDFNNPTNITVGATGASYTMPVTGLLYIQGATSSSSGYVGYKLPDGNFNNTRTPLGSGATLAITLRVKKGQTIIIQYGETKNMKALVYPCFPVVEGGSDDIIVLDSDGMGLTVKAGTYTSGTNEQVTEAKTVTLPTDTYFKVNDYEGNSVMLRNSEYNQLTGELTPTQVGTANSVNNGLDGQSGWTGLVGVVGADGSVISTFLLTPEKGKGLYTTDTVNVEGDVDANIKWAYTGTSITDTTSRTMELKLSVLHSDGTETLCGTKTESQPCQQTITVNSSNKTVSLSGSWYKTYSLNTTIPAKSMVDGDKLKFIVTYKNSTSASGIRQAVAIQPEITSNTITGTVNKIGFEDGMTEGTYSITEDYRNIWDLGYITMSNTIANKMDKWTKTNS